MSKKFVVVGGSSGIGQSLVQKLRSNGHSVVTVGRQAADGEHFQFDITGADEFPTIDGTIDGLAYCPGSINLKPFHRLSVDDFLTDLNINLIGAVRAIQSLLPNIKASEDGSIVLFSTVAVQTGMGFHASIAAAKGAVEGLTRSLAAEFAPAIRVNCIAPSLTKTPLAERLINTPEKIEALAARNPMKKIGSADEVASVAEFLLAGGSQWVTGQIFHVDGGMGTLK